MIEYFENQEIEQSELNNQIIELQKLYQKESIENRKLKIKESEQEERINGLIRNNDRQTLIIDTFKKRNKSENNIDIMIQSILSSTSELNEKFISIGEEYSNLQKLISERYNKLFIWKIKKNNKYVL